MIAPLDIFEIDRYGDFRWLESARDMDSAKKLLLVLGCGKYMVFSQKTGHKTFFTVDENSHLTVVVAAA